MKPTFVGYTFFRKEDNTLVRAKVGGRVEGKRTVWYIDFGLLPARDVIYFYDQFRACLMDERHEIRDARELEEDCHTLTIPYKYVKNIY